MFEKIRQWFGRKTMIDKNSNVLLENEIVAKSYYASSAIIDKQTQWINMYENSAEDEETLGLPAAICAELARLVTLELDFDVTDVTESDSDNESDSTEQLKVETRAGYIKRQMQPVINNIKRYVEYACAGGGLVFKPAINGDKIDIDINYANQFVPIAFNDEGVMTACMFLDTYTEGNKYYYRFEYHEHKDTVYTVTNTAYVTYVKGTKGKECRLSDVKPWAHLSPKETIADVSIPLFVYFKIPDGNCLDMTSPLGVSSFYRAIPQIIQADKQWKRYLWEFESGERIMEASEDAFDTDENGKPVIPEGRERLFWITKFQSDDTSKLTTFHSPEFREVAQKAGLNTILQRIEFNCGLAYGTLSDPANIDKTATEIKTSKQRSYSTVSDIQSYLDTALRSLADVINIFCDLYEDFYKNDKNCNYKLPEKSGYNVNATWDDSIIVDSDTERSRDLNEVRMGIMSKYEYRMKWYGEDKETAILKIQEQENVSAAKEAFNFNNNN